MTRLKIIIPLAAVCVLGAQAGDQVETIPYSRPATLIQPLQLEGKCHTQGIAFDDNNLYLSCVSKQDKKAWVYRVPRSQLADGAAPEKYSKLDVTEGDEYHPSGLDISRSCIWVAVAQYHPAPATSTLKCIDQKSFRVQPGMTFKIQDHIGTLAAMGQWIVGLNWDAKTIYLVDYKGKTLAQGKNPGGTAYQDCKHYRENRVICGGSTGGWSPQGKLDMLEIGSQDPSEWRLIRTSKIGSGLKRKSVGSEGMTYEGTDVYFVPEDLPNARLFRYSFPEFFN